MIKSNSSCSIWTDEIEGITYYSVIFKDGQSVTQEIEIVATLYQTFDDFRMLIQSYQYIALIMSAVCIQKSRMNYLQAAFSLSMANFAIFVGIFSFFDFNKTFLLYNDGCRSPPLQSEFFNKIQIGGIFIMAYNKAAEEKKWRLWKDTEEKELRRLGVSEDVIMRLRAADWEDFKAERRFYEHFCDTDTYADKQAADEIIHNIRNVQDLLDGIDREELHLLLLSVDKLTLQIAVFMMDGYKLREIAKHLSLTDKAVYRRVDRLKEKIKKYF